MNIVLTRTDRVGDLVLSTPAIASFRRSFPNAHVTLICSEYNAAAVHGNPDVNELVTVASPCTPREAVRALRRRPDLAVALGPRFADFRIVAATKAPRRIGYTYVRRYLTRLVAPLYLTDVLISEADPDRCEADPSCVVRHEVEQVLSLVERAGGSEIVTDLVVAIGDEDRARVADLPAGAIVIHLGHRWTTTGSTTENVVAILRELRRFGRPLLATYGADGADLAEAVSAAGAVNALAGNLPFATWAAAFEKSAVVVTVNTAATHVASAVRRPIVVLFEHRYFRLSSQEWSPYRVPSVVLRKPPHASAEALAASRAEIVGAVEQFLARTAPQRAEARR